MVRFTIAGDDLIGMVNDVCHLLAADRNDIEVLLLCLVQEGGIAQHRRERLPQCRDAVGRHVRRRHKRPTDGGAGEEQFERLTLIGRVR